MIRPGFGVVFLVRYTLACLLLCVILIQRLVAFAKRGKKVCKTFEFCLNRYDLWLGTFFILTLGHLDLLDSGGFSALL
jgi:cadmium resistance protein CadD (predicted permease)